MYYIDALNLLNTCIENGILHANESKDIILVMRETGWCREHCDVVARELMFDEKGQKLLIDTLRLKGIEFIPKYPI